LGRMKKSGGGDYKWKDSVFIYLFSPSYIRLPKSLLETWTKSSMSTIILSLKPKDPTRDTVLLV
jgi:hypothetical protein